MLAKCPDQRYHRTLGEAPKDGKGDCYVSPFVLHGYYAKYLDIFFQVLPSDQLLVVDYAAFAVDPAAVMDEVAQAGPQRYACPDTRRLARPTRCTRSFTYA